MKRTHDDISEEPVFPFLEMIEDMQVTIAKELDDPALCMFGMTSHGLNALVHNLGILLLFIYLLSFIIFIIFSTQEKEVCAMCAE